MQRLEGYERCTICGVHQNGFVSLTEANVCDTCVDYGPDSRLDRAKKLGKLEWSSGVNDRRSGPGRISWSASW